MITLNLETDESKLLTHLLLKAQDAYDNLQVIDPITIDKLNDWAVPENKEQVTIEYTQSVFTSLINKIIAEIPIANEAPAL